MKQYINPVPSLEDEHEKKKNPKAKDAEQARGYESQEQVYFAFIDVLGFKKTFDDKPRTDRLRFCYKISRGI